MYANTFAAPSNKNGLLNSNSEPAAPREPAVSSSYGIRKTVKLVLAPPASTLWANLTASLS